MSLFTIWKWNSSKARSSALATRWRFEDWCHLMKSVKKITLSKEKPLKQREGLLFSDLRTDTCGSVTRARDELYIKLFLLSVEVNDYFLLL